MHYRPFESVNTIFIVKEAECTGYYFKFFAECSVYSNNLKQSESVFTVVRVPCVVWQKRIKMVHAEIAGSEELGILVREC